MSKRGISGREVIAPTATVINIVAASVFGKNAPGNRINADMIGTGCRSRSGKPMQPVNSIFRFSIRNHA